MSPAIFLSSISVQHLALLKRAMRFSTVSFNDIVARAVSVLVAIGTGRAGWGYWALVAGTLAAPLAVAIGAWTQCRWIPSLPGESRERAPWCAMRSTSMDGSVLTTLREIPTIFWWDGDLVQRPGLLQEGL